jgi:hypothetical protein
VVTQDGTEFGALKLKVKITPPKKPAQPSSVVKPETCEKPAQATSVVQPETSEKPTPIESLVNMGFEPEAAIRQLEIAGGDIDLAVSQLLKRF